MTAPETQKQKNIVLVIATLGAGGAERVMSLLAGEWVRRGHNVTLTTLGPAGNDHYKLALGVKRVGLDVLKPSSGKLDAISNNMGRLKKLRQALRSQKPDVVISFMDSTNVLTLLATRGLSVPVIVSERIDPRYYPIASGWNWMRRKLYPRASAVVTQTNAVAEWAREFVPADKVHVIPNPVAVNALPFEGEATESSPMIISAMGRFDRQKGFDLLLHAFAEMPRDLDVRLVILGEGPEREALTVLAQHLGIFERVAMPGRLSDPFPVLQKSQLFVLSSRFEGFPNALLEAMSLGLPVISFSCPSGPEDIITDGENGLLVEPDDPGLLSNAMAALLKDKGRRDKMGLAARESMKSYSLDKITDAWEKMF